MSPAASCCGTTPTRWMMLPPKPPIRNFNPDRSATLLISLLNQPPICAPVLAAMVPIAVVLRQQLVHQFMAAAEAEPRIHLPGVQSERQRRAVGERRILAPVVIERGVAHLDGAALHGVEHLQSRHDLAGGEHLDLEFVVGDLGDALGEIFAAAIERIERLRPACRQPPFQFRRRLGDRRRGNRRTGKADAGGFQKFTAFQFAFHWRSPFLSVDERRPRS